METYKIITDKENWDKTINNFTDKDVYFLYGYFVPFKNHGNGEPHLFYFESGNGKVAYPFLLRDVSDSKNLKGKIDKKKYFDIISVYGYGGPLYELFRSCKDIDLLKKEFFSAFSEYCKKNNIISQFDRFHPLLKNQLFYYGYSELMKIRKTVHMDIKDKEKIWTNMDSKCRNMIRKAEKNGVEIEIDYGIKYLNKFKHMYIETMKRNNSDVYYLFYDNFFNDIFRYLHDNVILVNAFYNEKIISSSIILTYDKYLHYHFSGSLEEYKKLQANSLLLYKVAKWGCERGFEIFHLGGGYESEKDSLYKFKKSFNKYSDNNFFIGKKIHDQIEYEKLTELSDMKFLKSSYFPKYRA